MRGLACCLALAGVGAASADGSGFCDDGVPHFSGYLEAGEGAEFFYYLATSRSRRPHEDPLVLWLTGGPGCSSVLALLVENGPCRLRGRSSSGDGWDLERNEWSWTEAANVVWVDQPVGVGYSSPGQKDDLAYDGATVAARMVAFLRAFYVRFPRFFSVPFFIVGESYGGHYIPAVAAELVRLRGCDGVPELHGIAMGNALVDPATQWTTMPAMAFNGGADVGGSLRRGIVNKTVFREMRDRIPKCKLLVQACVDQQNDSMMRAHWCLQGLIVCAVAQILPVRAAGRNPYDLRRTCCNSPSEPDNMFSHMCYDFREQTAFLNAPSTKRALGVPEDRQWLPCNLTTTVPFILSGDELANYESRILALLEAGVRVFVYAGDTDFMVDWLGCQAWVDNLPWPHRDEWNRFQRTPFVVQGRTRGLWKTTHGLTFLQIFEAGHMVPMDQPEVALAMFRGFLFPDRGPRLALDSGSSLGLVGITVGGVGVVAAIAAATATLRRRQNSDDFDAYIRVE